MNIFKIVLAFAFFTTSITFSDHVLVSKSGLVSNWEVQIGVSDSHALEMFEQFE